MNDLEGKVVGEKVHEGALGDDIFSADLYCEDALPEIKTFMKNGGHIVSVDTCYPMMQFVGMEMVDVLVGQNYAAMGSLGVETLYKLIKGEEVSLGDETNFIDTGYEVVDISNYKEIWATKTPW